MPLIVRVPQQASGLLAAVTLSMTSGDANELRLWHAQGAPLLRASLHRAGIPPQLVDEIVADICYQAVRVVARRSRVVFERAWMSKIASCKVASQYRGSRQTEPLEDRALRRYEKLQASAWQATLGLHENRTLLRTVELLPPPYRQVTELQLVHHLTRKEIEAYLSSWTPVGADAVRRIIKEAHHMLAAAMAGLDPRTEHPQRYGKKNSWTATPPPPFPQLILGEGSEHSVVTKLCPPPDSNGER